ncbi:hypothetical protein FNN91_23285, partial [Salmonella enterica subsp. salamae]|nr:hypothetical protein [Salmonella enterica subsp. salamae]
MKRTLISSIIYLSLIQSSWSAKVRDDISYQVYRDFSENKGGFKAGKENIPIYNRNGELLGILDNAPMPSFRSVVNPFGHVTLVSPQHIGSVWHNRSLDGAIFFGGNSYFTVNPYGFPEYDIQTPRLNKIVTEVIPANLPHGDETKDKNKYSIMYRVGSGYAEVSDVDGIVGDNRHNLIGGTGPVSSMNGIYFTTSAKNIYSYLLGTEPRAGDSGSPAFGYDSEKKQWSLLGFMHGYTTGIQVFYMLNDIVYSRWNEDNDPPVNNLSSDIPLLWDNNAFHQGGDSWEFHGKGSGSNNVVDGKVVWSQSGSAQLNAGKNVTFDGVGGEIILQNDINQGAGTLTFNNNYTVSSDDFTWIGGGVIVNDEYKVRWGVNGVRNDSLHKLGTGVLVQEGQGINEGDLSVGDGIVVLNQLPDMEGNKQAFSHIDIVSGRPKVVLMDINQIPFSNIHFGLDGGELDIYGNAVSVSSINHDDHGAMIGSGENNSTGSFTFTGKGTNTFLGGFTDGGRLDKGVLSVTYAPDDKDSVWNIKGNTRIRGGMNVSSGTVNFSAPSTLHASRTLDDAPHDQYYDSMLSADYDTQYIDLGDSVLNISSGASVNIGRNTTVNAHLLINDNARVNITASGLLHNLQQGVDEGPSLKGKVELAGKSSTLTLSPEKDFTVNLLADTSGIGTVLKTKDGVANISGNILTDMDILKGKVVYSGNFLPSGAHPALWKIAAQAVLEVNKVANFSTLIKIIHSDSAGILSISGNVPDLISQEESLSSHKITLGSNSTLTLGERGKYLSDTTLNLRLGGGGGRVIVQGKLPLSSDSSLILGNGFSEGLVQLTSDNSGFDGLITLNKGIRLILNKGASLGKKLLTINYGSAVEGLPVSQIDPDSTGVLLGGAEILAELKTQEYPSLFWGASRGNSVSLSETLLPATKGWLLSGDGELNINSTLAGNHNLVVDGQGLSGGIVSLNGNNDFNGSVTVQGTEGEPLLYSRPDITLRLGSNSALSEKNNLSIGYGGILDLNGFGVNVLLNHASIGSLITSGSEGVLNIWQHGVGAVLAGTISGNLSLNKMDKGLLTVTGHNNYTGLTSLNAGKTVIASDSAFGISENLVQVSNSELDLMGTNLHNPLILDNAILSSTASGKLQLGRVELLSDSTVNAYGTSSDNDVYFSKYKLNGHTLTFNNSWVDLYRFGNSSEIGTTNGNVKFENSRVELNGLNKMAGVSLFSGEGSVIFGPGTTLTASYYYQPKGQIYREIILDGGTITKDKLTPVGASSFRSALQIGERGAVLDGDSWSQSDYLRFYGPLSGSGDIKISGETGVQFTGDLTAFTGSVVLGRNNKLYLSPDHDTSLMGNISEVSTGGLVTKNGAGQLDLKGDNTHFTGTFNLNAGNVVISNDYSMPGGIVNINNGKLIQEVPEGASVTFNQKISSGDKGTFIKRGLGVLDTGDAAKFSGNWSVEQGGLKISSPYALEKSDLTINADSVASMDFFGDFNWGHTLSGSGAFIKNNSGIIILGKSSGFQGDIYINQGGVTIKDNMHIHKMNVQSDSSLFIGKKYCVDDCNWLPHTLTVEELTASHASFSINTRPQTQETDSIIISKLARGEGNQLNVNLLLNESEPVLLRSDLILARAPVDTPNNFFTVNPVVKGLGVYHPIFQTISTDHGKEWRLRHNVEPMIALTPAQKSVPMA